MPDEPFDCQLDAGPDFDLRIQLPGARVVSVRGSTGGCSLVQTAAGDHRGGDELLDTVLDLVEAQRRRTSPAADVRLEPPRCLDEETGPPLSLTGRATELAVAVSCWRPDRRDPQPWRPAVRVPPAVLRTLLADMAAHTEPGRIGEQHGCRGGRRTYYYQDLVGRTRWNDLVVIHGFCRELHARITRATQQELGDGGRLPLWHPSSAAKRLLDGLRR